MHSSKYAYGELTPKACIKINAILVKKFRNMSQKGKSKILKKFKIEFWKNGLSQANEIFFAGTCWDQVHACKILW